MVSFLYFYNHIFEFPISPKNKRATMVRQEFNSDNVRAFSAMSIFKQTDSTDASF